MSFVSPQWARRLPLRSSMGSSALIQFGALLATVVIGILLARGLGVRGYGVYGIAFAVISLLAVPGELGLPKVVMREVAAASARGDSATLVGALRWASRTALLASITIGGAAAAVVTLLYGTSLTAVHIAVLVGLPLLPLGAAAAVRTGALMGLHEIVRGQIPILVLRPVLFAILLLILFLADRETTPAEAMALNVTTAGAALLLAWYWLRSRLPRAVEAGTSQHRGWLLSSLSMAMIDGLRTVQGQIGILIVGMLAVPEEAGLLRVALSAVLIVSLPVTLVETVTSPQFARLFAVKDIKAVQQLATQAARLTTGGVIALTLPVLLFGRPLLQFFFGAEFVPAYEPLVILCLGQVANAMFGMNLGLLMMTGNEKRLTRAMAVALLPNLLLAALLVGPMGATGAAIGAVAYVLLCNILAWRDARRFVGVSTDVLQSARPKE